MLFFIIEKLILIIAVMSITKLAAMYLTLLERKLAAAFQDRRGPNRAGPFGILQPLADGVKLFLKEEIIPINTNKTLFIAGPAFFIITALITGAIIPWTSPLQIGNTLIPMQIADIHIGILYIMGALSIGVYGLIIGAWASNNKYSLMGGLRAASQIISYELPMGISLIALLMVTQTFSLKDMVLQQQAGYWNIIYQPLGFILFLICAFAESGRAPFDLPESENELVGGYHLEYSSMKLGLFLFAEYIHMFISSVVMVCLFFGGYDIPFVDENLFPTNLVALLGFLALLLKTMVLIFIFMWVRWTLPRFRYDQLMSLGWRKLIPLSLFNMIITALLILWFNH